MWYIYSRLLEESTKLRRGGVTWPPGPGDKKISYPCPGRPGAGDKKNKVSKFRNYLKKTTLTTI